MSSVAGSAVADACESLKGKLGVPEGWTGLDDLHKSLAGLGLAEVDIPGMGHMPAPAPRGVVVRSFGAVAVELSVDPDTGHITVHRAHVVVDAGRVMNPTGFRGQIEGGFCYGLSQAMHERLDSDGGRITTRNLRDYRIASIGDLPPLGVEVLQDAGQANRLLAVGELVNLGVAPAIVNGVARACGARVRELPVTAERVLRSLGGL